MSNLSFLVLLTCMLCGFPFWGPIPWAYGGYLRPWMWRSGSFYDTYGGDAAEITQLEIVIWLWSLCRLYSEVKQGFRQGAKAREVYSVWL